MIPALSIRQPWAWLIVHGHKDIENRDWPTNFRGRLLVHAGKTFTRKYYTECCAQLGAAGMLPSSLPSYEELQQQTGGLVGWTRITDCQPEHPSPWKQDGTYGFVLSDSSPMPLVPFNGKLNFFNVPNDAIGQQPDGAQA